MISKEEAQEKAKAIRKVCRDVYEDVYEKGLKGEDVIGPLSDIYQRANELSDYIEQTTPAKDATTTTGA